VFMHYVLYLVFTTHFNALINQKAWEKIESEELKFKTIFSKSPHPMIMISYKDDRIIDVNESFTHTLGYTKLEVVDKHFSAIKMFDLVKDREQTRQYETSKYEVINREVPVLKKNGDLMHTLLSISIINEFDNKVLLVSMTDITELYQLKEKLDHYAYYDYLTELPNRRLFIRNFNHRVHKREGFSIVSIDLDNFKQVNDVYGHDTGD